LVVNISDCLSIRAAFQSFDIIKINIQRKNQITVFSHIR